MFHDWFFIGLKGVIAGLLMAAPVGPVALLCFKRTLTGHVILALAAGLGAAFADTVLAGLACLSIRAVVKFLESYDMYLRAGGGMIVLLLGIISLFQKPSPEQNVSSSLSVISSFVMSFFLTVFNPLTIVAFAATFSAMGVGTVSDHPWSLTILTGGVLVGATSWWVSLLGLTLLVKRHFGLQDVWRIHQASGVLFILFGIFILASILNPWPFALLFQR